MDCDKYSWVNQEYIAEVLKVDSNDILDWQVKRAVGKGENYSSTLIRVFVDLVKDKEASFLIKCLPDGMFGTLIQSIGMWDKEIVAYKIIPLMEKQVGYSLAPKNLPSPRGIDIVLEDMARDKFKNANRKEQLDFEHCVVALEALAKFHAGSVAVREEYKEEMDLVSEEMCFRESRKEGNQDFFKAPFEYLAKDLENSAELKRFSRRLKIFGEKFWDMIVEASKPRKFSVLNHGDFWTNNILFKYDEKTGHIMDCRLIDFQSCRYTTPAHDLQYFFMSSVQEEVRESRLQELVSVYLTCLNNQLRALGKKPLLEEVLHRDLLATDCYGLYTATTTLAASIFDPDNDNEYSMFANDIEISQNPFIRSMKSNKYRQILPRILNYYEKKGVFEDNYEIHEFMDEGKSVEHRSISA